MPEAETGWSTRINYFSALNRQALINELQSHEYDLLVIGGGITGAGIALDAVTRGLSVALIEMQDFAAGTSSRSTKLIHGGLRYLKQLEIKLVREVGRERAILLRNAPHLVIPENLMLPIVKDGSLGKFSTSLGLMIFDNLVNVLPSEKHKTMSKSEALSREPLLDDKRLIAAASYTEYRTDDARLTLEVLKTASAHGALCASYVMCDRFIYVNKKVKGVQCKDVFDDTVFEIRSKQVVNATGPWVDKVRQRDGDLNGKRLGLTKGVHIVVSRDKLPINNSLYFDALDRRMLFAIPRFDKTYLGTTDTYYHAENLEDPQTTLNDINYLLDGTNRMFPSVKLKKSDIISSWAGLRPLLYEKGRSPSELSRKDELLLSESGLISIAGGKLTGYRQMAKRTVDLVCNRLDQSLQPKPEPCITENLRLIGGGYDAPTDLSAHITRLEEKLSTLGIDILHAEQMVRNYGSQTDQIIDNISLFDNEKPHAALIKSELNYCVINEACFSLNDFYLRRTGHVYFHPEAISSSLTIVAGELQRLLSLSDKAMESQNVQIKNTLANATTFL